MKAERMNSKEDRQPGVLVSVSQILGRVLTANIMKYIMIVFALDYRSDR
jgi:hypothetical protein